MEKTALFFPARNKDVQSPPTPGGRSKKGAEAPFLVAERGIFKGEMSRNISPLNGALPPLPTGAKEVAPGGETTPTPVPPQRKNSPQGNPRGLRGRTLCASTLRENEVTGPGGETPQP